MLLLTKTYTNKTEVNSKLWSSAKYVHGAIRSTNSSWLCPTCQQAQVSDSIESYYDAIEKKNGHMHNGKQHHHCHNCGRQFVQYCEQYLVSEDKRSLIERLLVERISLRGICRAVGVKLKWLLGFLVQGMEALPDHLHVPSITGYGNVMLRRLEVEVDEMASFVQKKANKQWIWIAMDATPRQVIAFHVGDRSRRSAKRLWAKISEAYRQHAMFYTDQYVVYEGVIPTAQHRAISKLARTTNHIERFNNTLRQRVSRLVREALSFSKKLANHIGAIKLFICHYKLTKAAV
jgi:insertion element IS1 protein InsB